MRACFVVRQPAWSGNARAFADAATLLAARGYETCFAVPAASETARVLTAGGHDVIGLTGGGGRLRAGWRLRGVVARRLIEVLFVHDDREHLEAAAAVRLAGRGAVVRRTPSTERLTLGRDGRLAMRLAATGFVFAHADDVRGATPPRGALAAHVAVPGVRAVEPPPAPAGIIGAAVGDAGSPRLAIISGIDRRHETLLALRTLALLAPRLPALRATVFTPAADVDAVRLEAAALGVADRIEWRAAGAPRGDALARARLAWVVASADDAAFAHLDALAHGVPVLAERTPVAERFVDDGITGQLRRRSDEAGWASVIAAALADRARQATMSAAARRAAARWPFEAGAEGWLQVTEAARDRARWIS
ncbi:MAG: glycosyltransferase family protein [Gemmatimonadaceae bacterium]